MKECDTHGCPANASPRMGTQPGTPAQRTIGALYTHLKRHTPQVGEDLHACACTHVHRCVHATFCGCASWGPYSNEKKGPMANAMLTKQNSTYTTTAIKLCIKNKQWYGELNSGEKRAGGITNKRKGTQHQRTPLPLPTKLSVVAHTHHATTGRRYCSSLFSVSFLLRHVARLLARPLSFCYQVCDGVNASAHACRVHPQHGHTCHHP